jgi:hypothetical protein
MSKTAFLILAHSASNVLNEFIDIMDSPDVFFVVHVDEKINIKEYTNIIKKNSNILFCENRYKIYWGGFNMIRATIEMSKVALSDNSVKNFFLISDDSFPLHKPSDILKFIENQPNRIECYGINNNTERHYRYSKYYFPDSAMASARWLPMESRYITDNDLNSFIRLANSYKLGKYQIQDLRGGSQWWSLSREILAHCLEQLNINEHLRTSFEFSAIPDEMLFQTLAHNYMSKNGIPYLTSPMMADFTKNPKPYVYTDEKSIPFGTDEKLFVRKIISDGVDKIRQDMERRFT